MLYLYLDESGDLGFDFVNAKPSNFFTVAILAINDNADNRSINKAVRMTLRRKLNPRNKRRRLVHELKGTKMTIEIKRYFYDNIRHVPFGIYAVTLNKRRVFDRLAENKARVYNYVARKVLDQIPFEKHQNERVQLILDRSKTRLEIEDFNQYIRRQLEGRLDPKTPLDIYHWRSDESGGLQAIDLMSWGIFQKYEKRRTDWYDVYQEHIRFDEQYL